MGSTQRVYHTLFLGEIGIVHMIFPGREQLETWASLLVDHALWASSRG